MERDELIRLLSYSLLRLEQLEKAIARHPKAARDGQLLSTFYSLRDELDAAFKNEMGVS